MNNNYLFSPQDFVLFQVFLREHLIAAAKAPLVGFMTSLQAIVLFIVGYIEYEIIFRVFEFLSGENNYWSPEIMGLTAAVMIIGFHVQAKNNPDNFAVRFVTKSVQFLIPVYMLGVGLLIASILDVGSVIENDAPLVLGKIPEAMDSSWMETLFSDLTDPLAALAFSLGLGGLVIVNIFVAHHLATSIFKNVEDITGRLSRAKEALKDHAIIKRTHRDYAKVLQDDAALEMEDETNLQMEIATTALNIRDEEIAVHQQEIMELETAEELPYGLKRPSIPTLVHKRIKHIEAISVEDILKALTTPKLLEKG